MIELIYLILLLGKVFISSLKSLFSYQKVTKRERKTTIFLEWKNKKLELNFKEFQKGFDEATVKDLKEKCKQLTDVPIASMQLQISGANIKDDTATLTSVGVRTHSIVSLNGEKVNDQVVVEQTASGNPEEYALMVRISKIVESISAEQVEEFEQAIQTETDKKKLQDKGIYLSEIIMQSLIKLDCVECPMEFETARQRRREGVRFSQKLLERVDKAKLALKQK